MRMFLASIAVLLSSVTTIASPPLAGAKAVPFMSPSVACDTLAQIEEIVTAEDSKAVYQTFAKQPNVTNMEPACLIKTFAGLDVLEVRSLGVVSLGTNDHFNSWAVQVRGPGMTYVFWLLYLEDRYDVPV